MTDRIPGKPGQYKATVTAEELSNLQSGQQFVITLVRDDQPSTVGTPYNKASVLPDTLAAVICPDVSDPTPAEALASLLPLNGGKAMTGNLNMGGFSVKNLAEPLEAGDAVPKSYVDPMRCVHNLLDNTYFSDPINQREKMEYTSVGYTIDRWYRGAGFLQVTLGNNGITLSCTSATAWYQNVGRKLDGKTVTFAVGWGDGHISVVSTTIPENEVNSLTSVKSVSVYDPDSTAVSTLFRIAIYKTEDQLTQVRIVLQTGKTISVQWAALYEGEYTAETLPGYVPKGYAAELLECMRYYQIRSTNDVAAVDMRPLMFSDTQTITEVTGGYAYSAEI